MSSIIIQYQFLQRHLPKTPETTIDDIIEVIMKEEAVSTVACGTVSAIDEFIAGKRKFDDEVLEEYAKEYARVINSNLKGWSWAADIKGGSKLSSYRRTQIIEKAKEKILVTDIKVKKGEGVLHGYADFAEAGVVVATYKLPEDMWLKDDDEQFKWLNEQLWKDSELQQKHPELFIDIDPYEQPTKFTWHHTEGKGVKGQGKYEDGTMQLVGFGPHNMVSHNGGRTERHWADAPRQIL